MTNDVVVLNCWCIRDYMIRMLLMIIHAMVLLYVLLWLSCRCFVDF